MSPAYLFPEASHAPHLRSLNLRTPSRILIQQKYPSSVEQLQPQNILVARTDRIGDVVLSLPMISVVRSNVPAAHISFLIRSYTKEIVEGHAGLDAILFYDHEGKPKRFFTMLAELKANRFDLVVLAYPTFRLALLAFLAGIPTRVGTGYRWYSFLLNRRVFEHRKTAEKHELEYNLSLLKAVGHSFDAYPKPTLTFSDHDSAIAGKARRELGLLQEDHVVVLHPGSGGSAREWSPRNFGLLARELRQKGYKVVVTGGPGEEELVSSVVRVAGDGVLPLAGRLMLKQLAAFCSSIDLFISNSTGPLHIAAAVGIPVIAFYPPIRACSPERWGPYTEKKVVFVPDRNKCPRCHGGSCRGNDCMDQISVSTVVEEAERILWKYRKQMEEARP